MQSKDRKSSEKIESYKFREYIADNDELILKLIQLAYKPTNRNTPTLVSLDSPTASGKTVSILKEVASQAHKHNALAIFFTEYTANYQQEAEKLMNNDLYKGIRNDAVAIGASMDKNDLTADTSIIIMTPDMYQKFNKTLVHYINQTQRRIVAFIDESHVIPQQSELRECFSLLSTSIRDIFDTTFFISATPDKTLNNEARRLLNLDSYTTIKCIREKNITETITFRLRAVQPKTKTSINHPYLQIITYVVDKLSYIYSIWKKDETKARNILLMSVMDRSMHYKITKVLSALDVLRPSQVESFTGDRTKQVSQNIENISKTGMLKDNTFLAVVTSVLHQAQSIDNEGLKNYCVYPMRIDRDIAADENRQVISRGRRAIKDGESIEAEIFLHREFLTRTRKYNISESQNAEYVRKKAHESDIAIGINPNEENDNEIKALIGKKVDQNNPFEVAYQVRKTKLKYQTFQQYVQDFSAYYPDQSKIIFKFRKLDGSFIQIADKMKPASIGFIIGQTPDLGLKEAVRELDFSEVNEYIDSISDNEIRRKVVLDAERIIPNYGSVLGDAQADWDKIEDRSQDAVIELFGKYARSTAAWLKENAKDYKTTGFIDKPMKGESDQAANYLRENKIKIDVFIKEALKVVSLWGCVDFNFAYSTYKTWREGGRDNNMFIGIEQVQQAVRMSESIMLRLLLVNDKSVSNSAYSFAKDAITKGSKRLKITMQSLTDVAVYLSDLKEDVREKQIYEMEEQRRAINDKIKKKRDQIRRDKSWNGAKRKDELRELERERDRLKKRILTRKKVEDSGYYAFYKIAEMFSEAEGKIKYLEHTTLDVDKFRTLLKFTDAKLKGEIAEGRRVKQGEFCITSDLNFDIDRVSKDLDVDLKRLFWSKYRAALKKAIGRLEIDANSAGDGEKRTALVAAIAFINEGLAMYEPSTKNEAKQGALPENKTPIPECEFTDNAGPGELVPNKDIIKDIPIKTEAELIGVPAPIDDVPF